MAKGKKTGGRDWPKGYCPNPLGGAAGNPFLQLVKGVNKTKLAELGKLLMEKNYDELEILANNPQTNGLVGAAASAICKAHRTGDWEKLDSLLNRIVGKPIEKVEIEGFQSFVDIIAGAAGKKLNGPRDETSGD